MAHNEPIRADDIDRAIRINEAKLKIEEATGGQVEMFEAADAPAAALEAFWRSIAEIESGGEWVTDREQLEADGIDLPPPAELAAPGVAAKLGELFTGLAVRGVYLSHTNHLSDRELYERLWNQTLDEQHPSMPAAAIDGHWFVDMVGSGSEEDTAAFLRYYADEPTRRQWREDWPDAEVPAHEDPPCDRDRFLPTPAGDP